jgi:hypothetical protein
MPQVFPSLLALEHRKTRSLLTLGRAKLPNKLAKIRQYGSGVLARVFLHHRDSVSFFTDSARFWIAMRYFQSGSVEFGKR